MKMKKKGGTKAQAFLSSWKTKKVWVILWKTHNFSTKGIKHSIKRVYSVNTSNADNLLRELHRKSDSSDKKEPFSAALTLNLLLKFMCKIYQEKVRQDKSQLHVPLHVTCYELLLNRYGLKHVADQNLKKVYQHLNFNFLFVFFILDFFKLPAIQE